MNLLEPRNVSKELSLFRIEQMSFASELNLTSLEATMTVKTLQVLLIAGSPMGMSFLAARLTKWACEIHFASSCQEANAFLSTQKYDLVLSELRLRDGSAYPLADLLLGSDTTLVYSYAVENSCWWLPAVKNGRSCWGSLAMQPSEIIGFLDGTIKEIRSRQTVSSDEVNKSLLKEMIN